MIRSCLIAILYFLLCHQLPAQLRQIDRQLFFLDDRVIETTITTDIKKLRNDKNMTAFQPADITLQFSDTSVISGQIGIKPRGIYRKQNCDLASLLLNFKTNPSSKLAALKELKLVGGCRSGPNDEALLLKEYVVYKLYNFISVMSFRVRLLHVTYKDNKEKAKSYSQYAFLIEDIKDMAKRNNCTELKNKKLNTEATDRRQINLVSIFQYMIGNTDWSVPAAHNIKLMQSKNDTLARPYPIPYDFDYAGLVNAPYAVPAEELGTKSVTERVYRGFARNEAEIQTNVDVFRGKKEQIMFYVQNFALLSPNEKKQMTRYLEDFYKIAENKRMSKSAFIDNARSE